MTAMPTKRSDTPLIAPGLAHYFQTGTWPGRDEGGSWELFTKTAAEIRAAWVEARDTLLAAWIPQHPGTRPAAWWAYDAPQEPVHARLCGPADTAAQRRRLGGIGTPAHEVLNYAPAFAAGIPTAWVSRFDEQFYNGRARDIHGAPIGTTYHEGHFAGLAPRRADPPRFESQATYLERHGLLPAIERRSLPAAAFDPDVLAIAADEDVDVRAQYPHVFGSATFDDTREPPS